MVAIQQTIKVFAQVSGLFDALTEGFQCERRYVVIEDGGEQNREPLLPVALEILRKILIAAYNPVWYNSEDKYTLIPSSQSPKARCIYIPGRA